MSEIFDFLHKYSRCCSQRRGATSSNAKLNDFCKKSFEDMFLLLAETEKPYQDQYGILNRLSMAIILASPPE